MAKNQPTIDAFMDRRWSSEYHFLSKLYNKLLHRPTNDVVNFRGRGWVDVLVLGGSDKFQPISPGSQLMTIEKKGAFLTPKIEWKGNSLTAPT